MPGKYFLRYVCCVAPIVVVAVGLPFAGAQAQALPGLIVTVPPSDPPAAKPAARPKPKAGKSSRRTQKKHRSAAVNPSSSRRSSGTAIAALVNDEPITQYEIEQRARLMSLRSNLGDAVKRNFQAIIKRKSTNTRLQAILKETIDANRGKSREQILAIFERRKKAFALSLQQQAVASARAGAFPTFKKKALEELIEERLKTQEAKRLNIAVSEPQLNASIGRLATLNKTDMKGFENNVRKMGVDFTTMRERIRAQLSWNNVVQARFSRIVAVNQRDIDEQLAGETPGATDSGGVKLKLYRITLNLPEKFGQSQVARRFKDAEGLRRKFKGCGSMPGLAKSLAGAQFEDLGTKSSETVPEPTRSLLMNARANEIVPPTPTSRGIEMYAVCGRDTGSEKAGRGGTLEDREKARSKLRRQEFEMMGRRHLSDLRRDAHIEYR